MTTNSKEIVVLDIFDAVRKRPGMYIGQIAPMEDKLPLIINGQLKYTEKIWSPGFMHLIVEILENAVDEAKRCKGKMKHIWVTVNLDTNQITVTDEGQGFHDAAKKHPKTKRNVVRTALEELHAGSNFSETDDSILGTNGVGAAVTNILSEYFSVVTVNKTHYVKFEWKDYKVINEEIRAKESKDKLGTSISFIPSSEIFPEYKWDIDLLTSYLSFKSFLISIDPIIKDLELKGTFIKDGKENQIEIKNDFVPKEHIKVETKLGSVFLWKSYENSCSLAFINGSQCTGIQQKIVNDWCNEYFKYNLAHHFYETMVILNVPSSLMKFADQNKTKYAITRYEIEDLLKENFFKRLIHLLSKSEIANAIEQDIEDRLHNENINKIKKAQKISKRKITDKFSPSSKYKTSIYITEGLSAAGSVKQARDSEHEAVYALKGKIKNTRKLSDLTENKELLEIMSILDIEPNNPKLPVYEKIIMATDEDPDGQHISSLIINFFHKWFPEVIRSKKLYRLITPLVGCNIGKERKYFYTLDEYNEFLKTTKVTNVAYLKGLGSLSLEDWKYVMDNKVLFQIVMDAESGKYLEIAFGDSSNKRKKWLEA